MVKFRIQIAKVQREQHQKILIFLMLMLVMGRDVDTKLINYSFSSYHTLSLRLSFQKAMPKTRISYILTFQKSRQLFGKYINRQ